MPRVSQEENEARERDRREEEAERRKEEDDARWQERENDKKDNDFPAFGDHDDEGHPFGTGD